MPPRNYQTRPATEADAEAICTIYNDAVATTTATMDTEPRTLTAQQLWLAAHNGNPYPCLIAETEDKTVIGFASLSPYHPRPGYRTTTEVSIYIHPHWRGKGAGNTLLAALLETAWAGGFISLISLITADNIASIRLHERHGFTNVGTLRKVGRKFDQWVDVTFMQLIAPETKISS